MIRKYICEREAKTQKIHQEILTCLTKGEEREWGKSNIFKELISQKGTGLPYIYKEVDKWLVSFDRVW